MGLHYFTGVYILLLPSQKAEGYVLIAVYLFIYSFVCIQPNRMKFSGMIGYYPGNIWLDFGSDRVKGQGQGHEKVKILFLP